MTKTSNPGAAERLALALAILTALIGLLLGGCTFRGEDGTSYLALEWSGTPRYVDLKALPSVVVKGVFYEHPEGTWSGEYVAWDGSWYSFWYTIEVNEGQFSDYDAFGVDGADRYYTLYLYGTGPELYFRDDPQARALSLGDAGAETASPTTPAEVTLGNGAQAVDRSLYDLSAPQAYRFEREGPRYRVRIEGQRFAPLPR